MALHRRYRENLEKEGILLERLHRVPKDASAHGQLAALYESANAPDRAVSEYETLLEMQPGNARARSRLSLLYAEMGRYDRQARLSVQAANPDSAGGA